MEIINENSDEFYRKKYLKYKQKYIEAQQLYGEELKGGYWGQEFFVFCPYKNFMLVNDYFPKIDNLESLFILLGDKSYKTLYLSHKLTNCWEPNTIETNFWKNNDTSTLGLGYYTEDGKKKKSMAKAEQQAQNFTYGNSPNQKLGKDYRFFVLKSNWGSGYTIRYPYRNEQIKPEPIIQSLPIVNGKTVSDAEANQIARNDN